MTTTSNARTRKAPAKGSTVVIPEGAKAPQDHKPKDEPVKYPAPVVKDVDDGREVTYRGATVVIPNDALDDFELLGDIRAMQDSEDASYFPSLTRRLVGNDGYREVMDAIRSDSGRVRIEDGVDWIQSVFEALHAGNS